MSLSCACVIDGPKALVCDQCGAQFSKEDDLETHRHTHTGNNFPFGPTPKHLPFCLCMLNIGQGQYIRALEGCISSLYQGTKQEQNSSVVHIAEM